MANIGEISKNSNADATSDTFELVKNGAIGIKAQDELYLINEPLGDLISVVSLIASGHSKLLNGSLLYEHLLSNPFIASLPYQMHFNENGIKTTNYSLYNI